MLIIDQKTVDEYTVKLQEALSNLKFKPADYTKVKAALNKIPSDLSIYTDESVKLLEEAKAAINWDKLDVYKRQVYHTDRLLRCN